MGFSQTHLGVRPALLLTGNVTVGIMPRLSLSLRLSHKGRKMPSSCSIVVRTKQNNLCYPHSAVPDNWKYSVSSSFVIRQNFKAAYHPDKCLNC